MDWLSGLRHGGVAAGRCLALAGLAAAGLALSGLALLVLVVLPIGGLVYSTQPNHANVTLILPSSALGPVSSGTPASSSAMPQIGQLPGPAWRISGCIGQV